MMRGGPLSARKRNPSREGICKKLQISCGTNQCCRSKKALTKRQFLKGIEIDQTGF